MIRKFYYYFLILCWLMMPLLMSMNTAWAFVYDNCDFAWEFGQISKENTVVYPYANGCSNSCRMACMQFSMDQKVLNINQDLIEECTRTCMIGKEYKARYRIPTDVVPFFKFLPSSYSEDSYIEAADVCGIGTGDDGIDNVYTKTFINVSEKAPLKIRIVLTNADQLSSKLYMCGNKQINIEPSFFSLQNKEWAANNDKWNGKYYQSSPFSTEWHARNPNWFKTGIYPKDGDYLSINVGGPYYNPDSVNGVEIGNRIVDTPTYLGLLPSDDLKPVSGQSCQNLDSQARDACYKQVKNTPTGENIDYNNSINFLGLIGNAVKISYPPGIAGIEPDVDGYVASSFSGILSGYGSLNGELLIRHADNPTSSTKFADAWRDNIGGKVVSLTWLGCPYQPKSGLQYGVVPPTIIDNFLDPKYYPENITEWVDIPSESLDGMTEISINTSTSGILFFRIKPAESPYIANNPLSDFYHHSRTSGQYKIKYYYDQNLGILNRVADTVIKFISDKLFGTNNTRGVAQTIYLQLLSPDGALVQAIKVLMVLYVTITGLSFIIGTAQMNQHEALIRLFKLAIVALLLSPASWSFFNEFLFDYVRKASLYFIAYVFADTDTLPADTISRINSGDLTAIFGNIDKPISELFIGRSGGFLGTGILPGGPTWHKMQALVGTSVMGIFIYVAVFLGGVFYMMAVFKALLIYLLSLVGISILIMTAPLFISMILFAKTREMFDAWIKLLLSFALQPVLVFTMMAMLAKVLMLCLYTTLSFGVCQFCIIPNIFSGGCIFDWYKSIYQMHTQVGWISTPISSLAGPISFILIAVASYAMIDLMTMLATQLVSGAYMGIHLSVVAQTANPLLKAIEITEVITGSSSSDRPGQNREVKRRREAIINRYKDNNPLSSDS